MNKKVFIISTIIMLLDQISKMLATIFLKGEIIPVIPKFFYLTYVENTGAAWSILSNKQLVLIILTLVLIVLLHIFMRDIKPTKKNIAAFSLIYGGIWGNLIDRIFHAYVVDFLDFYIFGYDFPVFNIADMAIVIGIFFLILEVLKGSEANDSSRRK